MFYPTILVLFYFEGSNFLGLYCKMLWLVVCFCRHLYLFWGTVYGFHICSVVLCLRTQRLRLFVETFLNILILENIRLSSLLVLGCCILHQSGRVVSFRMSPSRIKIVAMVLDWYYHGFLTLTQAYVLFYLIGKPLPSGWLYYMPCMLI